MHEKRIYLAYLFRLGREIVVLEAVFLAFSWMLNRYWAFLQRFSFADVLFIMSSFVTLIGSAGMMRNPYGVMLSPWGVWASSIQASEQEKHAQQVDELVRQTSFGLRLVAIGVITILLSIALTYIK